MENFLGVLKVLYTVHNYLLLLLIFLVITAEQAIPVKLQRELVYKKSCYSRIIEEKDLLRKEMANVLKYYLD